MNARTMKLLFILTTIVQVLMAAAVSQERAVATIKFGRECYELFSASPTLQIYAQPLFISNWHYCLSFLENLDEILSILQRFQPLFSQVFNHFVQVLLIEDFDEQMVRAVDFDEQIPTLMAPFVQALSECKYMEFSAIKYLKQFSGQMIVPPYLYILGNTYVQVEECCLSNGFVSIRLFMDTLHHHFYNPLRLSLANHMDGQCTSSTYKYEEKIFPDEILQLVLSLTGDYLHFARLTCRKWRRLSNIYARFKFEEPGSVIKHYFRMFPLFRRSMKMDFCDLAVRLLQRKTDPYPSISARLLNWGLKHEYALFDSRAVILALLSSHPEMQNDFFETYLPNKLFYKTVKRAWIYGKMEGIKEFVSGFCAAGCCKSVEFETCLAVEDSEDDDFYGYI